MGALDRRYEIEMSLKDGKLTKKQDRFEIYSTDKDILKYILFLMLTILILFLFLHRIITVDSLPTAEKHGLTFHGEGPAGADLHTEHICSMKRR